MSTLAVEFTAEDYAYESTEEALDAMSSAKPAAVGHALAWFDKLNEAIVIDGRQFFADRVEYAPELDSQFVQWVMDTAQDYPVYGQPDDARPDTFKSWAVSVTDKYLGSPCLTGWDTSRYDSFLPDDVAGQFFRKDGTTYVAMWSHNCGYMKTRPIVFEVSCYESSYLLDDDKVTIYCGTCQHVWEVENGSSVRKVQHNGEEMRGFDESVDAFASDPNCDDCGNPLGVEMAQF
ncbi:hypothetical protein ACFWAP_00820 [Streptomyces goshikiensis]|uniref:hypothetical protein n=1 Tax=Streptomyces goshikiensis TaxID=1942 RepID=UPI003664EEE1